MGICGRSVEGSRLFPPGASRDPTRQGGILGLRWQDQRKSGFSRFGWHLAALRRWTCGGTNWKATSYFLKAFFISRDHLLSRTWSLGANPLWRICREVSDQVVLIYRSWRVLRGLVKMALMSYSYKINTYLYPREDCTGNFSV